MHHRLLALLVSLTALLWLPQGEPAVQDVATLVADIQRTADQTEPAKIQALAAVRTREAMLGLKQVYESMASGLMRVEVLRGLATFDGVEGSEQEALEKIANVATNEPEPELRRIAIDLLGECKHLGKHFLALIVDSPAEDELRERAMRWHVQLGDEGDADWYTKQFEITERDQAKGKRARKAAKGKGDPEEKEGKEANDGAAPADDAEGERKVKQLHTIREMALGKLATTMLPARLVELARDKERDANEPRKDGIRKIALEELFRRNDKKAIGVAEEVYRDTGERAANRVIAARILAQHDGPKAAGRFLEDGRGNESVMPHELRLALADMVAEINDEAVSKKLVKLVGKSKSSEYFFILRAVRRVVVEDDKLVKAIGKLLAEEERLDDNGRPATPEEEDKRQVRLLAAEVLGERGDVGALPDLEAFVEAAKDEELAGAGLDAIASIRAADPEWTTRLFQYVTDPRPAVRNAALAHLAKNGGTDNEKVLIQALEDEGWSTRLAALHGLEHLKSPEAVAAIVARMEKEQGRMLHEFADTLWRLTGLPFETSIASWKGWWSKQEGKFTPISSEALAQAKADEELRWLRQTTKVERPPARFFGVTVVSKSTIFILDISGSMLELMASEYVDQKGPPRIDVAKRELTHCIDQLSDDSLFNIVVFSTDVSWWLPGGIAESRSKSKDEAKAYVEKLQAEGGTNLYGSLREAFDDPDVDTIVVLSDGEPSVGDVTDPYEIREHVRQWNEHRGVLIHSIAVGGQFQVLEWIATDSGGKHVRFD